MGFFDKRREGADLAEVKQEAVFHLRKIQLDTFEVIQRGMLTGCISEEKSNSWRKEINKYRVEIQDRFLIETKLSKAKVLVEEVVNLLSSATQQIVEQIEKSELELEPTDRIARLGKNFTKLFDDARVHGLITAGDRESISVTVNQYYEALARDLHRPDLRDNIKAKLLNELILDYYEQVLRLYQEITKRRNQIV